VDYDETLIHYVGLPQDLKAYVKAPDGSMKAETVADATQSALGRWMQGDGKKHGAWPEFSAMRDTHAKLHDAAAAALRRSEAGDRAGAEALLGEKTAFTMALVRFLQALLAMKRRATDG
jgi:hypothetical protein